MRLNTPIHKNILIKILKDVYTDNSLGPLLGFKGGTAAYLFYELDRFSVDLDFDLLDENKEQEVFDKVENTVKEYGTIKEKTNKRYTLFILLSYNKEAQNIKVEISDLGGDNGKIGRENVKLFRTENVHVRNSSPRADFASGLFPDPLLPFLNPISSDSIKPYQRIETSSGRQYIGDAL